MAAKRGRKPDPARLSGAEVTSLDTKRAADAHARRVQAMSLRLAGLGYEQIGERLGVSHEAAMDLVERSLAWAETPNVGALRSLEAGRLDRAQAAIWSKVLEGDLDAVGAFLRISQRRAKMLGLDAPTKIDLSVGVRQEMEAALATLEQVVLGEVVRVVNEDRA